VQVQEGKEAEEKLKQQVVQMQAEATKLKQQLEQSACGNMSVLDTLSRYDGRPEHGMPASCRWRCIKERGRCWSGLPSSGTPAARACIVSLVCGICLHMVKSTHMSAGQHRACVPRGCRSVGAVTIHLKA
jgi:hypothetical protein